MGQRLIIPETVVIDRQDQIEEVCARSRQEGRFAFDTEFVMEDRFESEVCLIQIATETSIVIIDPFIKALDIKPIWELILDEQVEVVVHAGQEDFALCVQHTSHPPRNVFDVQLAAGLIGPDYPLSLQKLVQHMLHIRLHKSNTLTDWRKRPLTPGQLSYAAEDVAYLLEARKRISHFLAKSGRTAWASKEFEKFEDRGLYLRAEEEKLARVKGAGSLKGQQLAVLHELLGWREKLAESFDRPARTVLKDYLLVEIAKAELTTSQEIKDLRGISLGDKHLRWMCKTIKAANELPPEKWPAIEPRKMESASDTAVIALMTALIRSYCIENDLAYSLVATKKSISQLLHFHTHRKPADRAEVTLLNGWRGETVGVMIDDVLEGKRTVHVKSKPGKRLLHISDPHEKK